MIPTFPSAAIVRISLEFVPRANVALLPSVDINAPAFPFAATSTVYVDASVTRNAEVTVAPLVVVSNFLELS